MFRHLFSTLGISKKELETSQKYTQLANIGSNHFKQKRYFYEDIDTQLVDTKTISLTTSATETESATKIASKVNQILKGREYIALEAYESLPFSFQYEKNTDKVTITFEGTEGGKNAIDLLLRAQLITKITANDIVTKLENSPAPNNQTYPPAQLTN